MVLTEYQITLPDVPRKARGIENGIQNRKALDTILWKKCKCKKLICFKEC